MTNFNEEEKQAVKNTLDLLCVFFKNERKQHAELIGRAKMFAQMNFPGWDNYTVEKQNDIVSSIVNEYEIIVGIVVFDPDIVEKKAESEYWLYKVKDSTRHDHFERYKHYLMREGFSPKIIQNLESTCEKVLARCANPKTTANKELKKGLVIGDVQSGKTSNYLGLMNMAYDYGYKIVVLLAGTTDSLRIQTQKRTDCGAVGAVSDSIGGTTIEYIGVGEGPKNYSVIPLTDQKHDFAKFIQETNHTGIYDLNKPVVLVIKKNKNILEAVGKRLQSTLDSLGKQGSGSSFDSRSILIIDDEADNASVNTGKNPNRPTTINRCIREIFNKFPIASYVGFTATPFANIFISPDSETQEMKDLFPSDFIVQLNTPSNYFGGRKVFPKDNDDVPTCIQLIEETEENFLPVVHDRTIKVSELAESLKQAIRCFLINNVIRTIRDQKTKHRSMMINITRYNDVQERILWRVQEYVNDVANAVAQTCSKSTKQFRADAELNKFFSLFNEDPFYQDVRSGTSEYPSVTWDEIQQGLLDEIKQIQIVVINSRNGRADQYDGNGNKKRFDYDDYRDCGARVIAIGGLVLSRGLTLEGLMVSYYSRNATAYDTLLQMCRWFGYRPKYEDLCRVYMTQSNMANFGAVLDAVENLKEQFREMEQCGKKPEDFGLMVKQCPDTLETTLLVTSRNKMRNSQDYEIQLNYGGVAADTSKLFLEKERNSHNMNVVMDFLNELDLEEIDNHLGKKNVSNKSIAGLIKKLKIPYINKKFDTDALFDYINKSLVFSKWDVVVASGDSTKRFNLANGRGTPAVQRQFHYDEQYYRIGRNNNRVMEPNIFKFGLSAELLTKIENAHAGQRNLIVSDYLCEERERPLFVIYPIDLKTKFDKDPKRPGIENEEDPEKVEKKDLLEGELLLAFAIGFPRKVSNERLHYKINQVKIDELTRNEEVDDEEEGYDDED